MHRAQNPDRRIAGSPDRRIAGSPDRRIIIFLILFGTAVRLALFQHMPHGYDSFAYREWSFYLANFPLHEFYSHALEVPADHLPGDLLILKGLAEFAKLLNPTIDFLAPSYSLVIKAITTLFDLVGALALLAIGMHLGRHRAGTWAAVLWWCNPASIFVTSVWGQTDSFSATLAVIALGLSITGHHSRAFLMLTVTMLIKPQYALLALPLFIAWKNSSPNLSKRWLRHVSLTAITCYILASLMLLPFSVSVLGGWGKWSLLERVGFASDRYPVSGLGAHNIWGGLDPLWWPPDDRVAWVLGFSRQEVGYGAFAIVLVGALCWFWKRWEGELSTIQFSVLLTFSAFLVLTRMHERYLIPTAAICFLLALVKREYRTFAAAVNFMTFLNITLRFYWPSNDFAQGWEYVLKMSWLENVLAVRIMVALTIIMFFWFVGSTVAKFPMTSSVFARRTVEVSQELTAD